MSIRRPLIILPGGRQPTFQPQLANVEQDLTAYEGPQYLALPSEVRGRIVEKVDISDNGLSKEPLTSHGISATDSLARVCRQFFHDNLKDRTRQVVRVPHNKVQLFLDQALSDKLAYNKLRKLTVELPHNSPIQHYRDLAVVLPRYKGTLEELKIFGVGPDGYGVHTSAVEHHCGKVDTSIRAHVDILAQDGQEHHRRIILINSLQFLGKLKVLVLDNLNMPVTPPHVLKNKPHLQRLRIGTDPRSVLHYEYYGRCAADFVGNLIYINHGEPPRLKELDIAINGATMSAKFLQVILSTLEILSWTIPDFSQDGSNYLRTARSIVSSLPLAKELRVLRLCIHGAMYDHVNDMGSFMTEFRDSLQFAPSLKVVELHIHSESPWFAQEFIEALPEWVERLYLSDHFVRRDISHLIDMVLEATGPFTEDRSTGSPRMIGDDLSRKDSIPFSKKNLGFVSYEYDHTEEARCEAGVRDLMRLNARLLDRERNRHLAMFEGRHIPYRSTGRIRKPNVMPMHSDLQDFPPPSQSEIEAKREELTMGDLSGDPLYFGNEDKAEEVFLAEPVAEFSFRSGYSYPVDCEVEHPFSAAGHWLSN